LNFPRTGNITLYSRTLAKRRVGLQVSSVLLARWLPAVLSRHLSVGLLEFSLGVGARWNRIRERGGS
jgi:hypothetical protein